MSIEIDSEQGICSVEIEGSRHRAPVDSLRIGTDAEARLSVLYIDGKRLHISEEDAQRLTARNPGGVRQVGHGSSAHALFQENPLGGIEYAVAGFLGFLFGFPGH